MSAIRRIREAWPLVLSLWLLQLCLAWLLAGGVRAAAGAAMHPYAWIDGDDRLAAIYGLLRHAPGTGAVFVFSLTMSVLLGALLWTLVFPAVAHRLTAATPLATCGALCIRWLPAMIAQTFFGLVLRAILVGGFGSAAIALGLRQWTALPLLFAWTIASLATDRARGDVVLHGAPRFSPMPLIKGLWRTVTHPRLIALGLVLVGLQWSISQGSLALVIADPLGHGTLWIARALSAAGLIAGLLRISAVLDASHRA